MSTQSDFHSIWVSDTVLIFTAVFLYVCSVFNKYSLSNCYGRSFLNTGKTAVKKDRQYLCSLQLCSNWSSGCKVKQAGPPCVLVCLAKVSLRTKQLNIYLNTIISHELQYKITLTNHTLAHHILYYSRSANFCIHPSKLEASVYHFLVTRGTYIMKMIHMTTYIQYITYILSYILSSRLTGVPPLKCSIQ